MEFLSLKRLEYADGLSRLISELCKPFEETVIATQWLERETKSVLCKKVRKKSKKDKYIIEKKKQIINQQYKKIKSQKIFFLSVWRTSGNTRGVKKRIKKTSIPVIPV